jgi:hypothetical protein
MTPQEQQLLDGLIQRVEQTQLPEKDQEAERRLAQTLGRNPDALYILCQTVLVQQYALEQAQKQLADAKQQLAEVTQPPPQQHTSFLGGLFGGGQVAPPPPPPYSPVYGGQPGYMPVAPPQYVPVSGGFGGGGFLQGALQTAAGVVAGEMAFRGIEDLMHGFGHEAGYGSDRELGLGGYDRPAVETNYGDDSGGGFGDRLGAADGDQGISPDIEDRRDSFVDSSSGDDGQNDDSGDFGGGDDGGGFDSGGDGF